MGSLVVCLILSVVTFAHGKTVLINDIVEGKLALSNVRKVTQGQTTLDLGSGFMNPVSYEGAVAIGMDSLNRAGDCKMDFSDNSIKYTYQIGQAIHAVYFRKLNSAYGDGSGYYRSFNSTINYGYTVSYAGKCQVTLDSLELKLGKVELCVHGTCFDSEKDDTFGQVVTQQLNPGLNKVLSGYTQKITESLNRVYCLTNLRFDSQDQIGKGLYVLSDTLTD